MRLRKLIITFVIGLLLLAVVAVAALFFVDPSDFRSQLEARATAAFNRQVQFDGPISLKRSLRPRIVIEDITIGNPDWASGAHFAKAEKIGIQVALLPLLRGNLRVLDVSLTGVEVFIEEGPDGATNYTFGDSGDSKEPGVLPSVEQLMIRDAIIYYRSADASISHYKIAEARLWNIPGQPERIEGKGSTKGMPFTIVLAADKAAELSGPQDPWSLKLDIQGPDMSLTVDGRMVKPFTWDKVDFRIAISGKQADSLESLLGVEFPTTGPFEISAAVNVARGSYKLTDLVAHVHGPSGTPDMKITNGEASGGQDDPLHIVLQGKYGDAPLAFTFKSERPFEVTSQTTPWPMEARVSIADTKLNIRGTMTPATAGESFELDAQLQGETLNALAQVLGSEVAKAGPYQFSFRTNIAEGSYTITKLHGTIKGIALWKTIRIVRGEASARESGSVKASIDAKLDNVPLALSIQGDPGRSGKAGATIWPVKFDASAPGATLNGTGSVVTTENRKVLQIATSIKGNRFESLGSLIGVSLPPMGTYDLSAHVSSGGGVHEVRNLEVQIGANRLTGSVRWEKKAPRPLLTGKLSSDSLALTELLDTASKSSSTTGEAGLLDRPITLDWLKTFDARLELNVKRVADSPIPVENVRSALTLANGTLSAPFHGMAAGAPVDGRMHLTQHKNVLGVSLKATIGRIDVGQTLTRLELPDKIVGTADAVHLDASSSGETLQALLEQAAVTLQIRPANLRYSGQIFSQAINATFESAEFVIRKDRPVTATFTGTLQDNPFNATVSAGNLAEIMKADAPLPVRVALQTADVQFKAEGTIARPFENNEFDLNHELTGKEIEGLSPLLDFAVPLRGAFRATGRATARGNRYTYEEDLRIGKSDLQVVMSVLRQAPRPKITASIFAREIHLDDMRLFEVDKDAGPTEDTSRVIPDYTIPVDILLAADLDLEIQAERIRAELSDLGDLVLKVRLKDGWFKSSLNFTGFKGARINSEFDLNAAVKPPLTQIMLEVKDLNYGVLLRSMEVTDLVEGRIDISVDLSGLGGTRRSFLGNADGHITVIGGPGKISSRRLDLWASDLIPTMLSPRWHRQEVTDTNCFVAHIELNEGLAEIEDLLLDTQRITIAGSGILDLGTEELNVIIAPRPKRASLVSLANPVHIRGTLSQPEVSVARLPRRRRLVRFGILTGLSVINPAFLIIAFSDIGTGEANPCVSAVERAYEADEVELE
ncbi:MAG: AsmA family protein [Gammaproteobacteria bacterium]